MNISKIIKMELAARGAAIQIGETAVAGDSGSRNLVFELTQEGVPWIIPEDVRAAVAFRTQSGYSGEYDTMPDGTDAFTFTENRLTVRLIDQILAQPGQVRLKVVMRDSALRQLSGFPVHMTVSAGIGETEQLPREFYQVQDLEEINRALSRIDSMLKELDVSALRETAAEARQAAEDAKGYAQALNPELIQQRIDGKGDDLYVQDGRIYLTANGQIIGSGIPVPEGGSGGLAFDGGFVDEEGYLRYTLKGTELSADVYTPIFIGKGGGGASSAMTLTTTLEDREITVMEDDAECVIPFVWSSKMDGEETGSGFMEWTVNGSRVALVAVEQGEASFDIRPWLTAGSNDVVLKVTDIYGNFRTMGFTVELLAYGLTWNLSETGIYPGLGLSVRLTPTGAGDKRLKLAVDGEVLYESVVSTTGQPVTVTVPVQDHGAHVLTAWAEVEGTDLKTDVLRHTAVWVASGNMGQVVAVLTPELTASQYGTAAVRFFVVDPASETVTVTLKAGGETVRVLENVDRTVQTWNYRCNQAGSVELTVETERAVGNVALTVEKADFSVSPVTEGLVLDLDPAGHSNTETGRENFGYTDGDGVNHPLTFSEGFDWVAGGFRTDSSGITAFVIPRGHTVTLDRGLFDSDCRLNGRTLKLVFRSENVRNYDARLMTCTAGKVGIEVTAQTATVTSQLETMQVPYYEGNRIEMEVCVQGENDGSLAWIELGGVQSCPPVKYGATDSWGQSAPAKLVIGSEDADVWLYRLKLHDLWLTGPERRANFVADALTAEDMALRAERNDIYNTDGTISLSKTAKANPELRVIHIRAPRMTTGKEDEVTCDFEHIYTAGGESHHLTASGAVMKAQGTSSLEYILAALNLDVDFSGASSFVNGLGEAVTEYAMTENSIPVNYFNLKANVASSESANNVCLADEYNTWSPYVCDPKQKDPRVRDTVEGHPCAVFFTSTADAPIEVGARTVQPGETILYFVGDMNNSKKNAAVFGRDNTKYPKQCCVEIMNNTEKPCRFLEEISDDETWKDGNFEFEWPKNPTDDMKNAFRAVQRWVVSTNRDAATGTTITPVTYDGMTYKADTAAYRAAKFTAEFSDYFVPEAMDFHYLFTDENCMPDNRAKNVFFCYEWVEELQDYRWSVRRGYDFDTGLGNDNSGGLTFGYGLEDTDMAGDAWVFNAHDSVLWCNIRDLRSEELTSLHIRLAGQGAWDPARRSKKFRDYQDAVCPALRSEDMHNKYFLPWINKDAAAYARKCYGTKADQRDQFFYYQRVYKGSQRIDVSNRSDAVSMRVTVDQAENGNMTITAYSDMYIVVMYGNGGRVMKRVKRNTPTLIECPTDSLGDTETYIFFASNLTAISSLAAMKPKFVLATTAERLQELIIGSGEVGYENRNLNQIGVGANRMLKLLDLRSCPELKTALDLSALTGLEEFLANGSGITGVTLAKGAPIHTLRLPALASLVALELNKLQTFAMDGGELLTLRVEGCPGIDTLSLCKAAEKLERGRLTDVDWTDDNADVLIRLSGLGGLDSLGKAADTFVLTGKCHVGAITQEELDAVTAAFPELEVTYDSIVPAYTFTFCNYDGTVLCTLLVREGEDAADPILAGLIGTPEKPSDVEYHYSHGGWDQSLQNADADRTITAVFVPQDRYYRVTFWSDDAESRVLQENSVIAHGSCVYEGAEPEGTGLWAGWDAETNDVVSDMDVHAVFLTAKQPAAVADVFDYLVSDDPEDDSAYTMEEFLWILENGKGRTYFQPGDRIKMVIPKNDTFVDSEIVLMVLGFNHFRLADGSGEFAGVVFGMAGVMNQKHQINSTSSNVGGWPAMSMRTYLNESVFSELPRKWQILIRTVQVLSSAGNTSAEIVTAEDRLFLLALADIKSADTIPYSAEVDAEAEEKPLPVFTDNASRVRRRYNGEGDAATWYTRSPLSTVANKVFYVKTDGVVTDLGMNGTDGVCWACCMGGATE